MRIQIRNARVVDPASGRDAVGDVYVADGRIAEEFARPDRVIDAKGLVLAPGFVDLAARLREPGFEYKATLESELDAALAGGVTSLACPPDTDPPLDEPGLVDMLRRRAGRCRARACIRSARSPSSSRARRSPRWGQLTDAGCVAFSQGNAAMPDSQVLWRALQYAVDVRLQGVAARRRPGARQGRRGARRRDGDAARPARNSFLCGNHRARYADRAGARNGRRGSRVPAVEPRAPSSSCARPRRRSFRSPATWRFITCTCRKWTSATSTRNAAWSRRCAARAIATRSRARLPRAWSTVLVSDHTPVDEDGKHLPFAEAEPGATGLELLLPLALKWGEAHELPLAATLARISTEPAKILGLDAGRVAPGAPADLAIFDPRAAFRVSPQTLRSQGKNTPFLGYDSPAGCATRWWQGTSSTRHEARAFVARAPRRGLQQRASGRPQAGARRAPGEGRRLLQGRRPRKRAAAQPGQIPDAEPKASRRTATPTGPIRCSARNTYRSPTRGGFKQRGVASWYGRRFHGQKTASGELYDMYAMTAAHPTLPIPSYVRVTNVANGRSVVVRVNDRGPFHSSRVIDLSYAAAYKLGFIQAGSAQVQLESVQPGREQAGAVYVQVGAFASRENAESLQARVTRELAWLQQGAQVLLAGDLWRLHVGPYPLARRRALGGRSHRGELDLKPLVVVR
jgi:dihydroorotase